MWDLIKSVDKLEYHFRPIATLVNHYADRVSDWWRDKRTQFCDDLKTIRRKEMSNQCPNSNQIKCRFPVFSG